MKRIMLSILFLHCNLIYSLPSIDITGLTKDGARSGSLACLTGTACLITSQVTPVCYPCALGAANACLGRSASQCFFGSRSIIPSTPGEVASTLIAGSIPYFCPQDAVCTAVIGCYSAPSFELWVNKLYKRRNKIYAKVTKYFSAA